MDRALLAVANLTTVLKTRIEDALCSPQELCTEVIAGTIACLLLLAHFWWRTRTLAAALKNALTALQEEKAFSNQLIVQLQQTLPADGARATDNDEGSPEYSSPQEAEDSDAGAGSFSTPQEVSDRHGFPGRNTGSPRDGLSERRWTATTRPVAREAEGRGEVQHRRSDPGPLSPMVSLLSADARAFQMRRRPVTQKKGSPRSRPRMFFPITHEPTPRVSSPKAKNPTRPAQKTVDTQEYKETIEEEFVPPPEPAVSGRRFSLLEDATSTHLSAHVQDSTFPLKSPPQKRGSDGSVAESLARRSTQCDDLDLCLLKESGIFSTAADSSPKSPAMLDVPPIFA
uniref:Uncharacterized protein n=1 Tax=Chromera velia CCMP2878 TaxID=1169474 RepID=A0A0G4ICD4_9ALVE|eukprot:Cvel_13111.t1-p1 / transcript=Cvel_13111.t1 / gene=Cvel_13111 / organism=Chromera_velia_CCMP2878 / gene_product=hypothetical protein / transcript_product=hypothetical protein / location=Cvel_scaffold883:52214-53355(-) / protein_length=341 / sequence_SO=supercontig / SO=protein_coding / is_pseudo=false